MARLVLVDSKRPKANSQLSHRASASEGEASRRLLEDQGYPCKRVANGQMEFRCPFHEGPGEIGRGKGTNFYVNATTSVYYCQAASCGERGNLKTLEKHFGIGESDEFVSSFRSREEQLRDFERYLTRDLRKPFYDHGLNDQTIERFRLGWEPEHEEDRNGRPQKIPARYIIPYLEGRRPRYFRYYAPYGDPKWKYTWETGAEGTLFNGQDAMGDKDGRVFLCEGELKAMMLVQLGYAAVAVPGAGQWKDEHQAAFTHARQIIVCYDNDNPRHHNYDRPEKGQRCQKCAGKHLDVCVGHNPGQDAALVRVEQLGWRAKNVVLPWPNDDVRKTDINDYFMRDGRSNAEFAELATGKSATPFKVKSYAEIAASPPEEATFLIEQGILPKGGRLLIVGKPKVGKAQPLSTRVLTPAGWTTMGELKVGDQVIGADGAPTKVVAIHPQGRTKIYTVTMSDGTRTRCTAEHLWTIQTHNDRTGGRPGRVMETQEIAERLRQGRDRDTYVPVVGPVQYEPREELPLDAYGLGLLITSGHLGGTPTIGSRTAEELVEPLTAAFPGVEVRRTAAGINLTGGGQRTNPLLDALRELGLDGMSTWERFIPPAYLLASVQDRLSLLQGLMDGSGWSQVNRIGNASAHLTTSSRQLFREFVQLVQSLGGIARVRFKAAPKHQGGVGRPSWTIGVRLPDDMCPFRTQAKAERWRNGRTSKNVPPTRRIVDVSYHGVDQAQCITVAAQDGLYVTDDFIVTHNSILVDNLAMSLASGIPFLKRFQVDHPTRTLLLDRELSKRSLFERIGELTDGRPGYAAAWENLLIDHDFLLKLDQPNALDTLLQLILQNGAEVLIMDTAYKFFTGDVESSSTLMKAFDVLDAAIRETGVSVVMTHHMKKSQGGKGKENTDVADPDSVAGSYLWTGWPNATVLLNYLNRSVENPYNAICTFTAFRDHAPPEPLALYRDRTSISYSAIQDYSHDEMASRPAAGISGKPTTEDVATLLLELCPTTEDDFLHIAAARWGVSIPTMRPYYIDALGSGHFEKTNGRPPILKYKHAGPEPESWEHEHGMAERKIPDHAGAAFQDVDMFDAAVLQ